MNLFLAGLLLAGLANAGGTAPTSITPADLKNLKVPEKKDADPTSATDKADQWESKKGNNELFTGEIKKSEFQVKVIKDATDEYAGSKTATVTQQAVRQRDALVLQQNTMTSCLSTSLSGRGDKLCKDSPMHPECLGLSQTNQNALCNTPGYVPPDPELCKDPKIKDYTADEWIAFGYQYFEGMKHCAAVKIQGINPDAASIVVGGTPKGIMDSLTETPFGIAPAVSASSQMVPTSGISGTVPATTDGTSLALPASLTEFKINDGSAILGYENGEILKRAKAGDQFYGVVMDSPVVEELKPKNRAKLEHGLLEPNLVLDKARMAGRLPGLGENLDQYEAATDPDRAPPPPSDVDGLDDVSDLLGSGASSAPASAVAAKNKTPKETPEEPPAPAKPAVVAAEANPVPAPEAVSPKPEENKPLVEGIGRVVVENIPPPAPAASSPTAEPALAPNGRRLTLAERIAAVEARANAIRRAKEAGQTVAEPDNLHLGRTPAASRSNASASLFARVKDAYQRRRSQLAPEEAEGLQGLRADSERTKALTSH